jgi:hypothetical protein
VQRGEDGFAWGGQSGSFYLRRSLFRHYGFS